MSLWIRSQNKKVLTVVNELYVSKDEPREIWTQLGEYAVWLGGYETEERALEVLDEIQKTIINNEIIRLTIPNVNDMKNNEEKYKKFIFNQMIYEMPKE